MAQNSVTTGSLESPGATIYDADYYWKELVTFSIGNELIRVASDRLVAGSTVFAKKFHLSQLPVKRVGDVVKSPTMVASNVVNLDDEGVTAAEFLSFINFFYPPPWVGPLASPFSPTQQDYINALKLSTKWHFNTLRKVSIDALTSTSALPDITRVCLGKTHNVPAWVLMGYQQLVTKGSLFTDVDAKTIGWETAFRLCKIREMWLQRLHVEPDLAHRIFAEFETELEVLHEQDMQYLTADERARRQAQLETMKTAAQVLKPPVGPVGPPVTSAFTLKPDAGKEALGKPLGLSGPVPRFSNPSTQHPAETISTTPQSSPVKKDLFSFKHLSSSMKAFEFPSSKSVPPNGATVSEGKTPANPSPSKKPSSLGLLSFSVTAEGAPSDAGLGPAWFASKS